MLSKGEVCLLGGSATSRETVPNMKPKEDLERVSECAPLDMGDGIVNGSGEFLFIPFVEKRPVY
jgi:hypothetical protein